MTEKRYAIVRVNNGSCPSRFEDITDENVCFVHRKKEFCRDENLICTECYYGDTKEQLIKKVAQALELCMKKGYRTITLEEYAKFIVEFLGVK